MHDAPAFTAVLFGLRGCLVQAANGSPAPAPGALETLDGLRRRQVPCIWLDEPHGAQGQQLASVLPTWLPGHPGAASPWPAPDACWQALIQLQSPQLDGCVVVSGDPRLLACGLNAGLWTVGLAACSPSCDLSSSHWQAMTAQDQELARGKATLELFSLGVHSVIDHLEALDTCLADIAQRRRKGEKP
ncbi:MULTISPECIES: phosphonoacetaldehyde phosphonohydrolase-related protein [Pseudomonas]|uniref:Beta-phosphoglucomutase-like phosphatase (HAD superfamily) n=1 Tax=Pseudomonas hunanensis TaxID=1247546 RepID=A0ACC6K9Y3_9PSED|nr:MULTISPECIES: phosphonoacetaldehyde phosphonohydrolase-related protein [Pseudomonas]MBP2263359.1 beta-phosphoglucomutase-like phosphatase (HAD superfamily) [Pseudomonas sp. BP8]MDR6715201.1 beta-phosphoglucomutase-like phosphatase (HAD superfamily) [Pseudomonas hunanensis]HDS1735847.1 phosphonoacetaldehyde phosphonohydrolase-related protein [Pseudomonas putida]